ncbi:DUF4307 domain-containing protein [Nocardioides sp. zg-536]|uniref:DUF4307 domain-containing protein n=1 Tax=Nocardioides faecalis TaxID=2803858 RepID=A0A938Y5F7_9ACTN|nr:DUF4307 domain-containing protein [Nocardioides faecalis]MBM9459539.1 DUF4307 domain-containing protein [Nocardioides faecalis]MBS4753681.1 DUF4307 domain-containing protein [Nocardioides faecalis]QVI58072.1 DUF4307 domain-containing protein [Nocardioides faecalis]
MSTTDTLAQRYGAPSGRTRLVALTLAAVLGAALVAWMVWAWVLHSDASVASQEVAFEIHDDHSATMTVDIELRDDDVAATCKLRAISHDKAIVGQVTYQPDPAQGRRHVIDVKTERRATTVEWLGCNAPDQPHYR